MNVATWSHGGARVARFVPAIAIALATNGARAQELPPLDAGVTLLDSSVLHRPEHDAYVALLGEDASLALGPALPELAAPPPVDLSVTSAPSEAPVEIEIRTGRTNSYKLMKTAEAVTVVNLAQARKRSADLGEILNRVAGVSIRRYGGLGSEFRVSINGLYDNAVRVFIDGIPIDRVYAMPFANIPVNLIDAVEVYRGVVPLRFGADALGGTINLVRPKVYETRVQGSYSVGSFGTHRAVLTGRYRDDPSGFVVGVDTFYDRAENNYFIDVETSDERGQITKARVRRFHDAYQAYGAAVEVGVIDRPWARKLLLRGFRTEYDKEDQHNIVMTVPYGEVRHGEAVTGVLLTYENTFREHFDVEAAASYAYEKTDFADKGEWVYDWRGRRIRQRRLAGEIEPRARDQSVWQHALFARLTLDWRLAPGHVITASLSPTFPKRTGNERIQPDPTARDALTAERKLFKHVTGLAYTTGFGTLARAPKEPDKRRIAHHRLENVLFAKSYIYRTRAEDPLPGNVWVQRSRDKNRFGVGDNLRLTVVDDWLLLKASYEYAIRLPEADEVFGNGVLILPNLVLEPELSHNANVEFLVDKRRTSLGDFWVDVNLFARSSENLIVLLGNDRYFTYQNVYGARSLGVENTVRWTTPSKYATLEGQLTYTDQRNASSRGTFGDFKGDRIPARPWLTASWGAFLHFEKLLTRLDGLDPFYQGRFVGEFFRGWESVGLRASKDVVPKQINHDVGITYSLTPEQRGRFYFTFEVQNLTDARLYDSFRVQRPSRGYYAKLSGEY